MASLFGHGFAAYVFGNTLPKVYRSPKLWLLAIGCAIFPDADVAGFHYGIAYGDFWGHRGFSHSLVFAFLFGMVVTTLAYRKHFFSRQGLILILFFSLATASHGLLDMMTSGGMGVAYFAPFDNSRHFLPWRPIQVSPIGISRFFSSWGLKVLLSEMLVIGIPGLLYLSIIKGLRYWRK